MGDCTVWAVKDSDLILCIKLHNCLADLNSDVVRVNHFLYSVTADSENLVMRHFQKKKKKVRLFNFFRVNPANPISRVM